MTEAVQREWLDDAAWSWWQDWRRHGDMRARERLVSHYQRFARIVASRLYGQHPYKAIDYEDYVQYANVGLIESLDRFDPDNGVRFESFSTIRIRGAILDGIRRSSDVQEQISARQRMASERIESLGGRLSAENAEGEELFGRLADVAIGLAVGFLLDGTGMYQAADEGMAGESAYQAVEVAQLGKLARSLVRSLPETQRAVITGHYLQQSSFAEIADQLQLSRGRIAQLHKEALGKLRQALQRQGITGFSC